MSKPASSTRPTSTTVKTAVATGGPSIRGTASRIIPVERKNIFLVLTVFFVFVNVIPNMAANVTVLAIYGCFFIMVLVHSRNRKKIPRWLVGTADDVIERLRENPFELLTIVGISTLTFVKNLVLGDPTPTQSAIRELCSIVLVSAAFYLSSQTRIMRPDRRRESSAKTLMMRLIGRTPGKSPSQTTREPLHPMVEYEGHGNESRSIVNEDSMNDTRHNMEVWEERQRERWDEWIEQELIRLNEDRGD